MSALDRWTSHRCSGSCSTWPTVTKSDGTGGPGTSPKRTGGINLRTAVGGRPNPAWAEWLMGFPIGWTEVDA